MTNSLKQFLVWVYTKWTKLQENANVILSFLSFYHMFSVGIGQKDACIQLIDYRNRSWFMPLPNFPKEIHREVFSDIYSV